MSRFSQFFSTNPGNLVEDPQRMPWAIGSEAELGLGYLVEKSPGYWVAEAYTLASAGAWTTIAAAGDVAQVTADDTYVTVSDITTGTGGVLTHLFLPGVTASSDIVTAKITVDGAAYTLAFTAAAATDRVVCGMMQCAPELNASQGFASMLGMWHTSGIVSGLAVRHEAVVGTSQDVFMLAVNPSEAIAYAPCLRFAATLKIEMKSSDFSSTNNRDDCGAVYLLNQY